jgi:predicted acyl esterase
VAQIDIGELRYQWFDFVFKGRPKPALLKNKVNYEVMGANRWKHAPSLAAMSNQTLRFHLSAEPSGATYRLSARKPEGGAFITQTVDLADRSDVDRVSPSSGIVDKNLDTWNSLAFVSEPFAKPTELSGLFSGRLDFTVNRKDLDFNIGLYELTPQGEYVALSYYLARASYVRDRSHRQLLKPGERQQLDFKSGRLTSRKFQPGSRLVVLLGVPKDPGRQINYGSGGDVSDESLQDGKEPLRIQWYGDSFIDVPVWR